MSMENPFEGNIKKELTEEEKEDIQDEKDTREGLELLKKLKSTKGEELPPSLENLRKDLEEKHPGEEMSEDFKEAEKALGLLKAIKEGKQQKIEEEKLVCPDCGRANKKEANFCGFCGEQLKEITEKIPIKCPNCNKENDVSDNFCRECGYKFPKKEK